MASENDFFSGIGSGGGGGGGGDGEDDELEMKRRVWVRRGMENLRVKLRLGFEIGEEKGWEIEESGEGAIDDDDEEQKKKLKKKQMKVRTSSLLSFSDFVNK